MQYGQNTLSNNNNMSLGDTVHETSERSKDNSSTSQLSEFVISQTKRDRIRERETQQQALKQANFHRLQLQELEERAAAKQKDQPLLDDLPEEGRKLYDPPSLPDNLMKKQADNLVLPAQMPKADAVGFALPETRVASFVKKFLETGRQDTAYRLTKDTFFYDYTVLEKQNIQAAGGIEKYLENLHSQHLPPPVLNKDTNLMQRKVDIRFTDYCRRFEASYSWISFDNYITLIQLFKAHKTSATGYLHWFPAIQRQELGWFDQSFRSSLPLRHLIPSLYVNRIGGVHFVFLTAKQAGTYSAELPLAMRSIFDGLGQVHAINTATTVFADLDTPDVQWIVSRYAKYYADDMSRENYVSLALKCYFSEFLSRIRHFTFLDCEPSIFWAETNCRDQVKVHVHIPILLLDLLDVPHFWEAFADGLPCDSSVYNKRGHLRCIGATKYANEGKRAVPQDLKGVYDKLNWICYNKEQQICHGVEEISQAPLAVREMFFQVTFPLQFFPLVFRDAYRAQLGQQTIRNYECLMVKGDEQHNRFIKGHMTYLRDFVLNLQETPEALFENQQQVYPSTRYEITKIDDKGRTRTTTGTQQDQGFRHGPPEGSTSERSALAKQGFFVAPCFKYIRDNIGMTHLQFFDDMMNEIHFALVGLAGAIEGDPVFGDKDSPKSKGFWDYFAERKAVKFGESSSQGQEHHFAYAEYIFDNQVMGDSKDQILITQPSQLPDQYEPPIKGTSSAFCNFVKSYSRYPEKCIRLLEACIKLVEVFRNPCATAYCMYSHYSLRKSYLSLVMILIMSVTDGALEVNVVSAACILVHLSYYKGAINRPMAAKGESTLAFMTEAYIQFAAFKADNAAENVSAKYFMGIGMWKTIINFMAERAQDMANTFARPIKQTLAHFRLNTSKLLRVFNVENGTKEVVYNAPEEGFVLGQILDENHFIEQRARLLANVVFKDLGERFLRIFVTSSFDRSRPPITLLYKKFMTDVNDGLIQVTTGYHANHNDFRSGSHHCWQNGFVHLTSEGYSFKLYDNVAVKPPNRKDFTRSGLLHKAVHGTLEDLAKADSAVALQMAEILTNLKLTLPDKRDREAFFASACLMMTQSPSRYIPYFHGPGRNGKSELANILQEIASGMFLKTQQNSVISNRGQNDDVLYESLLMQVACLCIAELKLNTAQEIQEVIHFFKDFANDQPGFKLVSRKYFTCKALRMCCSLMCDTNTSFETFRKLLRQVGGDNSIETRILNVRFSTWFVENLSALEEIDQELAELARRAPNVLIEIPQRIRKDFPRLAEMQHVCFTTRSFKPASRSSSLFNEAFYLLILRECFQGNLIQCQDNGRIAVNIKLMPIPGLDVELACKTMFVNDNEAKQQDCQIFQCQKLVKIYAKTEKQPKSGDLVTTIDKKKCKVQLSYITDNILARYNQATELHGQKVKTLSKESILRMFETREAAEILGGHAFVMIDGTEFNTVGCSVPLRPFNDEFLAWLDPRETLSIQIVRWINIKMEQFSKKKVIEAQHHNAEDIVNQQIQIDHENQRQFALIPPSPIRVEPATDNDNFQLFLLDRHEKFEVNPQKHSQPDHKQFDLKRFGFSESNTPIPGSSSQAGKQNTHSSLHKNIHIETAGEIIDVAGSQQLEKLTQDKQRILDRFPQQLQDTTQQDLFYVQLPTNRSLTQFMLLPRDDSRDPLLQPRAYGLLNNSHNGIIDLMENHIFSNINEKNKRACRCRCVIPLPKHTENVYLNMFSNCPAWIKTMAQERLNILDKLQRCIGPFCLNEAGCLDAAVGGGILSYLMNGEDNGTPYKLVYVRNNGQYSWMTGHQPNWQKKTAFLVLEDNHFQAACYYPEINTLRVVCSLGGGVSFGLQSLFTTKRWGRLEVNRLQAEEMQTGLDCCIYAAVYAYMLYNYSDIKSQLTRTGVRRVRNSLMVLCKIRSQSPEPLCSVNFEEFRLKTSRLGDQQAYDDWTKQTSIIPSTMERQALCYTFGQQWQLLMTGIVDPIVDVGLLENKLLLPYIVTNINNCHLSSWVTRLFPGNSVLKPSAVCPSLCCDCEYMFPVAKAKSLVLKTLQVFEVSSLVKKQLTQWLTNQEGHFNIITYACKLATEIDPDDQLLPVAICAHLIKDIPGGRRLLFDLAQVEGQLASKIIAIIKSKKV